MKHTRDTHDEGHRMNLDILIEAAARAYQFDAEDLVSVRQAAARDPVGMRHCYLNDDLIRAELALIKNPPHQRQTPAQHQAGHIPEPVTEKDTDMKIAELLPSTYLKKEDFPSPALLTLDRLERVNVAAEGQPPEHKWALYFAELDRALVLNSTNIQTLGALLGDDTDNWLGHKIVAFSDPTVAYAGKLVGGIRLRQPKQQQGKPAPAAAAKPSPFDDIDNDIPY